MQAPIWVVKPRGILRPGATASDGRNRSGQRLAENVGETRFMSPTTIGFANGTTVEGDAAIVCVGGTSVIMVRRPVEARRVEIRLAQQLSTSCPV